MRLIPKPRRTARTPHPPTRLVLPVEMERRPRPDRYTSKRAVRLTDLHDPAAWHHGKASDLFGAAQCAVADCHHPGRTRALCTPHHQRWVHAGHPELTEFIAHVSGLPQRPRAERGDRRANRPAGRLRALDTRRPDHARHPAGAALRAWSGRRSRPGERLDTPADAGDPSATRPPHERITRRTGPKVMIANDQVSLALAPRQSGA